MDFWLMNFTFRILEYPYIGRFYRMFTNNASNIDPIDWADEEVTLLETCCDIQEVNHTKGDLITASYSVFFPKVEDMSDIKSGIMFESNISGMRVNGKVVGVFPSQLGVKVYVEDLDV